MLPADCALKVVMLVEGVLIGLLRARVTANLQFDYVNDVRITKFLLQRFMLPLPQ
jgi:hypothetical protein